MQEAGERLLSVSLNCVKPPPGGGADGFSGPWDGGSAPAPRAAGFFFFAITAG